jgi:hypothetical protein
LWIADFIAYSMQVELARHGIALITAVKCLLMIVAGKECKFSFEAKIAIGNVCDFHFGALHAICTGL